MLGLHESAIDSFGHAVEQALDRFDFVAAHHAADRALAQATEPREHGWALYWQARCHYVEGTIELALQRAQEALTWAARCEDAGLESTTHALLCRCRLVAGDAQAALVQALAALRRIDDALEDTGIDPAPLRRPRHLALTALGATYLSLLQFDLALDHCQQAVEWARAAGDTAAVGAGIDTVACVLAAMAAEDREQGRAALADERELEAIRCSTEAVRIARECGHVGHEASALNNLAESLALVGRADEAMDLLDAWSQRNPAPLPRVLSHYLDTRGSVCLGLGRAAEAVHWFEQARRQSEGPVALMVATEHLAQALERCGRWQEALDAYKTFHALHVRVSHEKAQRDARIAEVRMETEQAHARADKLAHSNQLLQQRATELQRQADQDALTGLANRRHLERQLAGKRDDDALLILDVDHFKQVNDRHSHAVGDQVLQQLAELMGQSCRPYDTAARLGGEEFVLLLRGLPPEGAPALAERLRLAVAEHDWEAVAPGLRVTISIGLALGSEGTDGEALLALADQRLYAAKRAGRNCVVAQG